MTKILIIEDEPLIRRLYQTAFEFEGYEVQTAADGEEGLQKALEIKPTVILLDIMLPKMDGTQVLSKLKTAPETKKTPVIILSNLAETQHAERALELGAVRYIVKSQWAPKQIVGMVKEIVSAYNREEIPQVKPSQTPSTAN